jgi:predicted MFS family arabinose efflux permease
VKALYLDRPSCGTHLRVAFIARPGVALGVLTALNVLNYLDRFVGASVLQQIIEDLRLSDSQAGSLQTVFIVVYSVVSPFIGRLGDRRGRLSMAAVGIVVWSLATFGSGLAPTFGVLLLARSLVGVGEASYAVVTPSVLSDLFPADRRGRALAVFYAAMPVGAALGYILGSSIGGHWGWRAAFFAAGGPGLAMAAALLLLREPPRGRYDKPHTIAQRPFGETVRELWSRRSFVVNTVAQSIFSFTVGGLGYWMPTYFLRERHLTLEAANSRFGIILVVAGFAGTLLGGQLGDKLARRWPTAPFTLSGVALVATVPFVALAVLSPHPAIFWPAMFATLFLLFFNSGPLNAAMTNVLPSELRAQGFALYTVAIHLLGDGPSPKLIGMASDALGGLRLPVLLTGLLPAVGGVVLLVWRRTLANDLHAAGVT